MKKRKAKTHKEKAFLKEYANTLNATESAMRVYNCKDRDSAKSLGSQVLTKLNLPEALEAEGLTDQYLAQKTREGTEATKIHTSHTEPDKEVPDYGIRHKYVETALRLKGHGSDKMVNIDARRLYVVNLPARKKIDK